MYSKTRQILDQYAEAYGNPNSSPMCDIFVSAAWDILTNTPLSSEKMDELLEEARGINEELIYLTSKERIDDVDRAKIDTLHTRIQTIITRLEREKYRGVKIFSNGSYELYWYSSIVSNEWIDNNWIFEFHGKTYTPCGFNKSGLYYQEEGQSETKIYLPFDFNFNFAYWDEDQGSKVSQNRFIQDIRDWKIFGDISEWDMESVGEIFYRQEDGNGWHEDEILDSIKVTSDEGKVRVTIWWKNEYTTFQREYTDPFFDHASRYDFHHYFSRSYEHESFGNPVFTSSLEEGLESILQQVKSFRETILGENFAHDHFRAVEGAQEWINVCDTELLESLINTRMLADFVCFPLQYNYDSANNTYWVQTHFARIIKSEIWKKLLEQNPYFRRKMSTYLEQYRQDINEYDKMYESDLNTEKLRWHLDERLKNKLFRNQNVSYDQLVRLLNP